MNTHAWWKNCAAVVLCLVLGLALCVPCFAQEQPRQRVRVGYVNLQGFLYSEDDGGYGGLGYDILCEVAQYCNWEYEFVECSYNDVAQLFSERKLDLFVPFQRTPEREEIFEFSDQVFCTNRASLLTLPESPVDYENFEALSGADIGEVGGTRNGARFVEYMAQHGCQVTLHSQYKSLSELIAATKAGELDAFVSASNRGVMDFRIVSVLPQTDSYVVAPKGNREILDQFDSAMRKISVEMPGLLAQLEQKYIMQTGGSYPSLSQEERAYIAQKKQVSVLLSREECDEQGNFRSSAKVIYDNLSRLTGLEFVPVVGTSTAQMLESLREGEANVLYTFNRDFDWAAQHDVWMTSAYARFYNQIVTKPAQPSVSRVAVVAGSYFEHYVQNQTQYEAVPYASYAACIDAVRAGDVDATYCNSPIGNYYSTFPKYSQLSFLTAYDFETSYCMAVSQRCDPILVDILNKAILCVPQKTLSQAYEVQMNERAVTISDFYYTNPVLSVSILLLGATVVLGLIFTLFYMNRIRRKNRQLAVANSAKTDFMARMSHDMRTPMNGILGLAQLTRDETDPKAIARNLDQIELSGKVLLDLINDTLDMNKIESGKLELHPRPINSEEVFGNVLTNAQIMAAEKGVQLALNVPPIQPGKWVPVLADASRLEQVLINVISNAIKFTPAGGKVELIMETLSVDSEFVNDRYTIRDSGIGMSAEFLPHLFDAFAQEGRSSSATDQGTGLGMSIVKQLVDLMGGQIRVESQVNQGTTVVLEMRYPVYHGTVSGMGEHPALEDISGRHVLLCEDHPINAQIAVKLLQKRGVSCTAVVNGEEGLKAFEASAPGSFDCILMDIRMPVMDGLQTCRAIRALDRPDAKTVPIIAMTANAFEEDVRSCMEAGMNSHVAKPIDAQKLYQTLAEFMPPRKDNHS